MVCQESLKQLADYIIRHYQADRSQNKLTRSQEQAEIIFMSISLLRTCFLRFSTLGQNTRQIRFRISKSWMLHIYSNSLYACAVMLRALHFYARANSKADSNTLTYLRTLSWLKNQRYRVFLFRVFTKLACFSLMRSEVLATT